MNKSKKTSGFTFVEILIVLGIIGLLACMIIPAIATVDRTAEVASANIIAETTDCLKSTHQSFDCDDTWTSDADTNVIILNSYKPDHAGFTEAGDYDIFNSVDLDLTTSLSATVGISD